MPIARGTAACGYTTILALFWAAGMPISVEIPTGYQVDWEAILEPHPDIFIEALYKWLVPEIARPEAFKGQILEVDSNLSFLGKIVRNRVLEIANLHFQTCFRFQTSDRYWIRLESASKH